MGAVEFGDGAVDARSEAEVVGVNEEGHLTGYRVQGTGCSRELEAGSWKRFR
jgi:hypothetical protein